MSELLIAAEEQIIVVESEAIAVIVADEPAAPLIIGAGDQGPPGADGTGGNTESIPFAYGDATPSLIATIDAVVLSVSVVITEAFDGDGAALAVGTLASPSLLMNANQNAPSEVARYETSPAVAVNAGVFLTITPGIGATQGAGVVLLEKAA